MKTKVKYYNNKYDLSYLRLKPKRIFWEVIAPQGARLSPLQQYDVIFDDYDLQIRKLV